VLRAAGETETTQENIQDWLQLDEGDHGFQFLTDEDISAVIFYFHEHYLYLKFYIYLFSKFFRLLWMSLIRIIA
jgi:hypothetical protein